MKLHLILVGPSVLLAVAGSPPARAADHGGVSTSLTLERARALAAERAPSLLAARARAGVAGSALAGASVLVPFNPQLSAGAGPRFGGGGTSVDVDATLSQRFEIGGQRSARMARARGDAEAADAESRDVERRLLFDVSTAFTRVLHAEAALEVRSESASVAASLLRSVRRRHDVGEIGGLDVNVATVAHARAVAARERAAADRARAAGRLRGLLGFEPRMEVTVEGRLDRLPDYALDSLLERADGRPDLEALRSELP